MAAHSTTDSKPAGKGWLKQFSRAALLRSLICYTLCSWLEIALMTVRTSPETQVLVGLAEDLLSKMTVLLAASFLFGFSFIVFHWKGIPSAVKRFLHMVIAFIPVVMVSQSLVNDANLDTHVVDFLDLLSIFAQALFVNTIFLLSHQALSAQF